MAAGYSVIDKYCIKIRTTAPLHLGNSSARSNELLVHPVTDQPFLQASGLAGMLRAVSFKVNGVEETARLFGADRMNEDDTPSDSGSRIRISDGIFKPETVHLECRPRVAIDPVTGSVGSSISAGNGRSSGHKFEMELVGCGAEAYFTAYILHGERDDDREAFENLLSAMMTGSLQMGGQKSNGAGFFSLLQVLHRHFDLKDGTDRTAWFKEDEMSEEDYQDLTDKMSLSEDSAQAYDILITGRTEGTLLVKGAAVSVYTNGSPDSENMKNAAGQFIIPGSSLKGALRNRVSIISKYIKKEKLVDEMFGYGTDKDDRGKSGNVIVLDTIIEEEPGRNPTNTQHRIHIDQFTGGVMQTGLFTEQTVSGELTMRLKIRSCENAEAAAGMIILAVRDLAEGLWNLGSGYNVGRGFISVDEMIIRSPGKTDAQISFAKKSSSDPEGRISSFLQALDQWKEQ